MPCPGDAGREPTNSKARCDRRVVVTHRRSASTCDTRPSPAVRSVPKSNFLNSPVPGTHISIRRENPSDIASIHEVNTLAFEGPAEAELVDRLRDNGGLVLSLVAEEESRVIGHIAFSPVRISSGSSETPASGLAPMAVRPEFQGSGVGSQLVRRGLEILREDGHEIVVVLGHPAYYPRFGFEQSDRYAVACEFSPPAEAFMVSALREGALEGVRGTACYRPEFSEL